MSHTHGISWEESLPASATVSFSAFSRRPRMTHRQPCRASSSAVARPTPEPAPVMTAVLFIILQLCPAAFGGGANRGIDHRLRAGAVQEGGPAGALIANCVDELEGLIVAKCDQRIA